MKQKLHNNGYCISYSVIKNPYHHLKNDFDDFMNVHSSRHMCRSVTYVDQVLCKNVGFTKQPFEEGKNSIRV